MPDFLLRAEKLSKRYRILPTAGHGWHRNQRILVDDIARFTRRLRGKNVTEKRVTFWALKGISFEAKPGDVIGIIGRNGAGKSTLLKLLGRVTEPTSGRAIIYGNVGSLLEVGTGFHSELTGRENIFISGAIIGMSRAEIKRKFDEIVSFSGVEQFLDTPVKRFSSGMEVRLAFSVAAHLKPQVLLVDEVLSVGDAAFQQKSIAKIREVSDEGGTILFVSHNMNTVASLCNQAIVLDQGEVVYPIGPVGGAIDHYLTGISQDHQNALNDGRQGIIPGSVRITGFKLMNEFGVPMEFLTSGQPATFQLDYEVDQGSSLSGIDFSIFIKTLKGDVIAELNSQSANGGLRLSNHRGHVHCSLDRLPLAPGNISIAVMVGQNGKVMDRIQDTYIGKVDSGGNIYNQGNSESIGWLIVDQDWSIN